MDACKTSWEDVVIQDDNIAYSVRWVKSSSSVRDDDSLYTKKFEDSDGIRDSFD